MMMMMATGDWRLPAGGARARPCRGSRREPTSGGSAGRALDGGSAHIVDRLMHNLVVVRDLAQFVCYASRMRQLPLLSVLSIVLISCGSESTTGAQGGSGAATRGAAAGGGGDPLASMNAAITELQAREEVDTGQVQVQHVLIAFQGSGMRATRSKDLVSVCTKSVF